MTSIYDRGFAVIPGQVYNHTCSLRAQLHVLDAERETSEHGSARWDQRLKPGQGGKQGPRAASAGSAIQLTPVAKNTATSGTAT